MRIWSERPLPLNSFTAYDKLLARLGDWRGLTLKRWYVRVLLEREGECRPWSSAVEAAGGHTSR